MCSSSSTLSLSRGLYGRLNMDRFLPRPEEDAVEDAELERLNVAEAEPSRGPRACSFKNILNSFGASSGCKCAGTQKRWNGSSASWLLPSPLLLLVEASSVSFPVDPCSTDAHAWGDSGGVVVGCSAGKSGSRSKAPGPPCVVDRLLMSRRASSSRCIAVCDGCIVQSDCSI